MYLDLKEHNRHKDLLNYVPTECPCCGSDTYLNFIAGTNVCTSESCDFEEVNTYHY